MLRRLLHRNANKPYRVNPFKRALILGPFQLPITFYMVYVAVLYLLGADSLAKELGLQHTWPLYNFAALLGVGGVASLVGRFRSKERWEAFGLGAIVCGLVEASVLEVLLGMALGLGDNLALMLGCLFRLWVISKARKLERIANNSVTNNDDPEGQ